MYAEMERLFSEDLGSNVSTPKIFKKTYRITAKMKSNVDIIWSTKNIGWGSILGK